MALSSVLHLRRGMVRILAHQAHLLQHGSWMVLGEQPEVLTEDFVGWVIVVCGFEISSFSILEFLWV